MKKIFVINGFNIHSTATDDRFKPLIEGLSDKGYEVFPVDISWRHKTPTQFTREFEKLYKKQRSADYNIILGNSFGAVVAILANESLQPDELYLCSISPFFKEDRGKIPDSYAVNRFGISRARDLWAISFNEISKNIKTKTFITYGEQEREIYPALVERCKLATKLINGSKLHELSGAAHSMNDTNYTKGLLKLIN